MESPRTSDRAIAAAAWLNVGLHVAGLGIAALGMRPGTPSAALADRMAFLATAPLGWTLGWGVWMLCAIALVAFLAVIADRLQDHPAARLAVTLAVAGASIDLLCDAAWITVVPSLAARGAAAEALFLAVERGAAAGGAIVANGLYSISALLMSGAITRRPGGALAGRLGVAVFVCGMAMVAAGFTGDPRHLEWATGPTIGLYCVWTLAVARALRTRARG